MDKNSNQVVDTDTATQIWLFVSKYISFRTDTMFDRVKLARTVARITGIFPFKFPKNKNKNHFIPASYARPYYPSRTGLCTITSPAYLKSGKKCVTIPYFSSPLLQAYNETFGGWYENIAQWIRISRFV